jgi:hypothetical protein
MVARCAREARHQLQTAKDSRSAEARNRSGEPLRRSPANSALKFSTSHDLQRRKVHAIA